MEHKDAVTALTALAQTHRLAIFRLLVCEGLEGMAASEIAATLGIKPTSLSFHIKELEHAGLVTSERHGRSIRYGVRIDGMRALFGFLADDCCQGRPDLCGAAFSRSLGTVGACTDAATTNPQKDTSETG